MNELVQELKSRLKIEDLVCSYGVHAQGELKGRGRELEGGKNSTLKVYPVQQAWRWYAPQYSIERKQDVLSWIAYSKFSRTAVDGEDFIEVLRIGCSLCGLDFEQYAKHPKSKVQGQRRKLEDILERYVALGEDLRNPLFHTRVQQIGSKVIEKDGEKVDVPGKAWISAEICDRWRLIPAPTLKECERAGVSADELKSVELLREGKEGPYMFFRDSMLIPTMHRGRVQYLSSRTFTDFDWQGNKREKTKLHMPSLVLLPRPAAFHLDALNDPDTREKGIRLVEAPLDAIRMNELGKPTMAMYGCVPGEELIKLLRRAG